MIFITIFIFPVSNANGVKYKAQKSRNSYSIAGYCNEVIRGSSVAERCFLSRVGVNYYRANDSMPSQQVSVQINP